MDPDLTIVLLGNTGVGKSASGNTILGQAEFESKRSFRSVTKEICVKSVTLFGKKISVIDTPGIFCRDAEKQIKTCCQEILSTSKPCLFLVVIKIDRFTLDQRNAVEAAIRVLGKQGLQNSYLLFAGGDMLDVPLDDFIFEDEESSLPDIVEMFAGKYHLFNNEDSGQEQVRELLQKSGHLGNTRSQFVTLDDRRIVLLGRPGGGKSSSGNTILGSAQFRSGCGFNSVSTECVSASAEMEGHRVTVVDTPGFTDEVLTPKQLHSEIMTTLKWASPGPHAFVIVVKIDRITEADIKLFEILPAMFGDDAPRYSMVLFTHGDELRGQSIDQMIESNEHVSKLVSMCGRRYCVFNNNQKGRKQQVRTFLKMVDEMVSANGGGHYSSDMFRIAETFIKEDQSIGTSPAQRETALRRLGPFFERKWKTIRKLFLSCFCCVRGQTSSGSEDELIPLEDAREQGMVEVPTQTPRRRRNTARGRNQSYSAVSGDL